MHNVRLLSFCFFLTALSACDKPLPEFSGIDMQAWKNDKKACGGQRAAVAQQMTEQRNKLQGLTEMQIIRLLGRPDENELFKRNQKFYYYCLAPGKLCGVTGGKKMSIRFNATGAAKEIEVE